MLHRILHFSLGFTIIIIAALLISNNPKNIQIRFIIQILIIEIIVGYLIFRSETGTTSIQYMCSSFNKLLFFSEIGINFVFGEIHATQKSDIFFLNVLCPIIFISAIIGVLQYLKILTYSIKIIGSILSKISGMGKLESFNVVSSFILGQSENFIIYKNIIQNIPESRIYSMAITAMSTVSLSMIGSYITILTPKYVIAALILNMFSTFIILSLLNPYTADTDQNLHIFNFCTKKQNFFEIIGEYILIGFKIATTVAAMLIGFIALIAAINELFLILFGISFQKTLAYLFCPLAWFMGIPFHELLPISNIMATKLITNEFVAMINLKTISNTLSSESVGIVSVFLVSFSNITSIGIISGAIKELNTTQGNIVSSYGFKLIYSSTLINMLSAIITGLVI